MSEKALNEFKNDKRIPCKYGIKCFQKNPAHQVKYKHPPGHNKRKIIDTPAKRAKTDDVKKDEPSSSHHKPCGSSELETELLNDISTSNEYIRKETVSDSESNHSEELSDSVTKRETVSDSESDDSRAVPEHNNKNESVSDTKNNEPESNLGIPLDNEAFIKKHFLLDLPKDFYAFWDFCKNLEPKNPREALKKIDLKLVGPYDVLAGSFSNQKKAPEEFLTHWRYYYDPPEFLTILKGSDRTGYHIGYFYDSPNESPVFLAGNHGLKDGVFTKLGDNIFATVLHYLEDKIKVADPFQKMSLKKILTALKNKGEQLKLNLTTHSQKIKEREHKVVTKTFNKIGLVVPYDKKTQLGYRDLTMPDKDLKILLDKLDKASPEQKPRLLSELQPVLTFATIALDECDFGTGVRLGWELLFHGADSLNSKISHYLSISYRLLGKDEFSKIAEAHMKNRKKSCELSII